MGQSRAERAKEARIRSEEWAKKAALIEAKEKAMARKQETTRKIIVGGAVNASIRDGMMPRTAWETMIAISLSPRDSKRLGEWPKWEENDER